MKKREKKLQLSKETIKDLETSTDPAVLRKAMGAVEEFCINPPSSHFPHYCP